LKEEIKATKDALEIHRTAWNKTSCIIMTNGWIDKIGMTILNFLVNRPKETFFEIYRCILYLKKADKNF